MLLNCRRGTAELELNFTKYLNGDRREKKKKKSVQVNSSIKDACVPELRNIGG
jgi:hypothetical protein